MTTAPVRDRESIVGGTYSFAAYVLWGVMPLYFLLLVPASPWEVVAWRVLLSLVFCAIIMLVMRTWRQLFAIVRQPRLLALTALAGVVIYVNWQTFMIATLSGHVVETSLGYFINPIATVLLGVLVLHERLRPMQWTAIGIVGVAVIVIAVGYGAVPWYSLILTVTFSVYGLVKKQIGPSVDAVSGLTLESLWLAPIALVQLVVVGMTTGIVIGTAGGWHTLFMLGTGVMTAVPLLLFAAGARRISLTAVGLLQFVAPILQFLVGVVVLGEPMPTERWIGFGIVWVALAVLTVDSVRAARTRARSAH